MELMRIVLNGRVREFEEGYEYIIYRDEVLHKVSINDMNVLVVIDGTLIELEKGFDYVITKCCTKSLDFVVYKRIRLEDFDLDDFYEMKDEKVEFYLNGRKRTFKEIEQNRIHNEKRRSRNIK